MRYSVLLYLRRHRKNIKDNDIVATNRVSANIKATNVLKKEQHL